MRIYMQFKVGQFVRITTACSLAYGRIAEVAEVVSEDPDQTQVRFSDLPALAEDALNPAGLVEAFRNTDLSLIADITSAEFYLVVFINECNREQVYVHPCLAHGDRNQEPEAIAEAIAKTWYPEGSEWDEGGKAYVFHSDYLLSASVESFKLISVSDYIHFREVILDCTQPRSVSCPAIAGARQL
jgi:hypothetical protein